MAGSMRGLDPAVVMTKAPAKDGGWIVHQTMCDVLLFLHKRSALQVGDWVEIVPEYVLGLQERRVHKVYNEFGWANSWVNAMYRCVGKVVRVRSMQASDFELLLEISSLPDIWRDYWFPTCTLRKVPPPPSVIAHNEETSR